MKTIFCLLLFIACSSIHAEQIIKDIQVQPSKQNAEIQTSWIKEHESVSIIAFIVMVGGAIFLDRYYKSQDQLRRDQLRRAAQPNGHI